MFFVSYCCCNVFIEFLAFTDATVMNDFVAF